MPDEKPTEAVPRILRHETGSMMRLIDAGRIGTTGTLVVERPFYVDERPVSRDEFDAFCRATGRPARERRFLQRGSAPFAPVLWEDAAAYAAWAGKRLPTALEWRRAFQEHFGRSAHKPGPLRSEWVHSPGAQRAQACHVSEDDRVIVIEPGADTWSLGVGFRCARDAPDTAARFQDAPRLAPPPLSFSERVGDVLVLPAGALMDRFPLAPGLRHGVRAVAGKLEPVEVRWVSGGFAAIVADFIVAGRRTMGEPAGPRDAFVVGRLATSDGVVVARRGWPGLPLQELLEGGEGRVPVEVACRVVSDVLIPLMAWSRRPAHLEVTFEGELAVVPSLGDPPRAPANDSIIVVPAHGYPVETAARIGWWMLTGTSPGRGAAPAAEAEARRHLPVELVDVLQRCMSETPSERLRADHLSAALTAWRCEPEGAREFLRSLAHERRPSAPRQLDLILEELGVLPTEVEVTWQLLG